MVSTPSIVPARATDGLRWCPQSEARKKAELDQADQLFDAALAIDPKHVGAHVGKATLKIRDMQWADAEDLLRAALANHGDAPQLLDLMSQVMQAAANQRFANAADLRAAIAMEEAHAKLRGDTVQPGGDGLGAVRDFGLSMALRLKLAGFEAEQNPARAAELCLANVALEPRISEWAWGHRLSTAMLPDPDADTRAQPFPPQMAVLMAQSRLAAGRSLLATQKPKQAMQQFAPVLDYPQKLHEGGTIYLDDYLDWARLGLCDACIRLGDKQAALAWQMKVQGREFENPIEIERMRLRNLLGRQGRNRS